MIRVKLSEALTRAGKLERRAEIAINDGRDDKAHAVLTELRGHASRHLEQVHGLVKSLNAEGYSDKGFKEYVESFRAFRIYANEQLSQLTKGNEWTT